MVSFLTSKKVAGNLGCLASNNMIFFSLKKSFKISSKKLAENTLFGTLSFPVQPRAGPVKFSSSPPCGRLA
jgi:hypothetical protein